MSLYRLAARIAELEAQRAELEARLSSIAGSVPSSPTTDWESRLSAAKAVDLLTGSATAKTVESQRQADLALREQQARKAAQEAQRATQQREALESLTHDLDAAQALLARSIADAARHRLADCESRYLSARNEMVEAAKTYAGMLALSGQETAAHQLLRAAGFAGDTMTVITQGANPLRQQLLEETEHA